MLHPFLPLLFALITTTDAQYSISSDLSPSQS
jgi:hypothetical protein